MKSFSTKINMLVTILVIFAVLVVSLKSFFILKNVYWGDPAIYLIYARNITRGHWFEFNLHQFSSGATSPLWAIILALGFVIGDGVLAAKILSGIFTLAALLTSMLVVETVTRSRLLGVLGMATVARFLLLPGLMIYETPLIVVLINLAIYLTYVKSMIVLPFVWAPIPLVRPECTLLILLNCIWIIALNRCVSFGLISTLMLSMIPAFLYFVYSYELTGQFSTSSVSRGYMFKESVSKDHWQEYFRYLVPIIPLIFVATGIVVKRVLRIRSIVAATMILLSSLFLLYETYPQILWNSSRNLTFDIITEKQVIDEINRRARKGETILVYEVQDRFYLRDDLDLLSLDGITDGKIVPYFGDVTNFMKHYQPDYWLANDAINYRPYLAKSILSQVIILAPLTGDQVDLAGMRFTNIWDSTSTGDPQFASVTHIYKIDYDFK